MLQGFYTTRVHVEQTSPSGKVPAHEIPLTLRFGRSFAKVGKGFSNCCNLLFHHDAHDDELQEPNGSGRPRNALEGGGMRD